jgi:hypothetical protein
VGANFSKNTICPENKKSKKTLFFAKGGGARAPLPYFTSLLHFEHCRIADKIGFCQSKKQSKVLISNFKKYHMALWQKAYYRELG